VTGRPKELTCSDAAVGEPRPRTIGGGELSWHTLPVSERFAPPAGGSSPLASVAPTTSSRAGWHEELAAPPASSRGLRLLSSEGEAGEVLAEQVALSRNVVVKRAADARAGRALLREARVLGMLEHPNIPPVHQLGNDDEGQPVLVMRAVGGASWAELLAEPEHALRRDNPLYLPGELEANLEILQQLAGALQFAHARGVFHRNLEPNNVVIGAFGEVTLIGWGAAYHREIGLDSVADLVGPPGYLAPEMARGEAPDARTDVYLLGASLHHALTGTPRHRAAGLAETLEVARASAPVEYGPDVPSPLAALCNRATNRDPARRPQSALAFVQALQEFRTRRSAAEVADRAELELEQLEARALEPSDPDATDADRFIERATGCRFALLEARRAWPENPRLDSLERRLCEAVMRHAIAREELGSAREQARTLRARGALSGELASELERLEQTAERRRERERERELETGRTHRETLFLVPTGMLFAPMLYRAFYPWSEVPPHRLQLEMLLMWALVAVPLFVAFVALRHSAHHSLESRRLLSVVALGMTGIGLHRSLALVVQPGLGPTTVGDLLALGAATCVGALWLGRPFFGPAAVLVASAVLTAFMPERATFLIGGGGVIYFLGIIWAQRRVARARALELSDASVIARG
jgi:eukaryotic-like serine/threonine-protein kinase